MTLYTDVRKRIESMDNYDCQMFLKAVYLFGIIFPATLTGKPVSGAKNKKPYGPTGNDARLELIDQPKLTQTQVIDILSRIEKGEQTIQETRNILSKKIEVAIFRIKKTELERKRKSVNEKLYREIALPTQFDKWVIELYEYFKKAGTRHVFQHARSHYWALIRKKNLFEGLTYIVRDYTRVRKGISGKMIDKETQHLKDTVLTGLHHVRFEELQAEYNFDYLDWAVFTEKYFEVARKKVIVGDWHRYIEKLCKNPSFEIQTRKTLSDYKLK
jgi:hypothetical protein